jgi:hypothetical protein
MGRVVVRGTMGKETAVKEVCRGMKKVRLKMGCE